MKILLKYLKNYAEREVTLLSNFPQHLSFQHIVVIPAYKEKIQFLNSFLNSSLSHQKVMMIVVINQPDYDLDKTPQTKLNDEIVSKGHIIWEEENLTLVELSDRNSMVLIINRYTTPINEKQGVGLARKVGADIACELIQQNIIQTEWVHSTDADATLPENYFVDTCQNTKKNEIAACYNFSHISSNQKLSLANKQYEQALRYYVAGLTYAGSNYNFFTIGSVIAFKAGAYANVRGFPKRSAGEDFYLLNKLAKIGDIAWFKDTVLALEARESDRVPFGTGPAVKKIIELEEQCKTYCFYNPAVFECLKILLTQFECLFDHRLDLDKWYQLLPLEVKRALIDIHFENFVSKQLTSNEIQFNKQVNVWFDAFKTLKFIHQLRDVKYPDIPLTRGLKEANFMTPNV